MENRSRANDRAMTLVEEALGRPESEREAYLRSACGSNAALFAEAWSYVQWEKRMQGFLLDPVRAAGEDRPPFEAGQILINRFRVVREVARGGMGIVWEAIDQKLDRRVALKCAKEGFGKQLPPEVRNAREISHPNVCKIFEIHTAATVDGEIDFISMEFLEGETLAERLRRGPLPESEARAIAQQLCSGLAEAHRNHLIHGDLKPHERDSDGGLAGFGAGGHHGFRLGSKDRRGFRRTRRDACLHGARIMERRQAFGGFRYLRARGDPLGASFWPCSERTWE